MITCKVIRVVTVLENILSWTLSRNLIFSNMTWFYLVHYKDNDITKRHF